MFALLHLAGLTVTIFFLARVLPDVQIRSAGTALVVAVVFSVLNFFLGWLIELFVGVFLIVPGILTLGLLFLFFPFLVNTILLWLTDKVMSTFKIHSLSSLLMSAGAITAVNALAHYAMRSIVAGQMHQVLSPGPIRWI